MAQAQEAYHKLMNLQMVGQDINSYIAQFDTLVARAGWSQHDQGTLEKFIKGLQKWLAYRVYTRGENPHTTLDEWKEVV